MANIQPRYDKKGVLISYKIRVHKGIDIETGKQLKPYQTSFKVEPTWSEKTAYKKASAFASIFEKQCKEGLISDEKQTFSKYAFYVISLKERTGNKHSTLIRYKQLLERINPLIGHYKLCDIRPQHLNTLYEYLSQEGLNQKTGGKLSNKTIIEHHRLISTILEQASKELLVPYNVASRSTPPKPERKDVNYFQIEDIEKIRDCLESEPIKWKTITHLLLITGCRRGELLGLKWDKIDFNAKVISIENNLLYSSEKGIYEDTLKTKESKRKIKVPHETIALLKQYKLWQLSERLKVGDLWHDTNFVFTQDFGKPQHPDSVTDWLSKFSKRHQLPHINPHAFRHTMASILYFKGIDSISISKHLGHAKVSTTTDIYSHIIEESREKISECITEVLFNRQKMS